MDEYIRHWRRDPYGAFARLALDLRRLDVREAALVSWAEDRDAYEARQVRWAKVLDHERAESPSRARFDPLALLAAMDEALAAEAAGHEARPTRTSEPDAWVVPRPRGWRPPRQPRQLPYWLTHHWVLPATHEGIAVEVAVCDATVGSQLAALLSAGELGVFVAGFDDGVDTSFATPKPRYGSPSLSNPSVRIGTVREALELARGRAQVVVLPELTVCPVTHAAVSEWLWAGGHGFLLVCAGSFHEGRWNVARILDAEGEAIHVHHKLAPMRVDHEDPAHAVFEDIEGVPRLRLLATPIGLIAVAICLDFCEADDPALQTLWNAVGPGLVLVPSMSNDKTRSAHTGRAKHLARLHGTISAVAIQRVPDEKGETGGIVAWSGGCKDVRPTGGRVRGELHRARLRVRLLTDESDE